MPTAFVTGASRGIGRSIAEGLAENGWDLGLVATNPETLAVVADGFRARMGVVVATAVADVASYQSVASAVQALMDEVGVPELLVNNAGRIDSEVPVWEADPAELRSVVEVNLLGTLYLERAVLPRMVEAEAVGRIINLVSGAGARSWDVASAYTTSKAGQLRNVGDLADLGDRYGIRAFGVAPGVVRTDMTAGMQAHRNREEYTPVEETVALINAIARGELDAWSGAYLRAGTDTVEGLRAAASIRESNPGARLFGVAPWGMDDPLN
ncbi:SDR family NAD(P)-dependent oxidoreductase [Actinomyces minihominis]|uniref:SDR family NAD(P)-dependent oxidoreductase n=1 Tax=Actinomyces minihominis TaxID=2002838 RepID=UPI000C07D4EF|nr:SDR family oxidoreductase [Actinomyces minihominis]